MVRAWTRFLTAAFVGSLLVPVAAILVGDSSDVLTPGLLLGCGLYSAGAAGASWFFWRSLTKLEPLVDLQAREQTEFLDTLSPAWIDTAIAAAAALSLLLELAVIRWQGTLFP